MLKISNERPGNHAILIEAGMHGNEWTTVLSALYFIDAIIPEYKRLSAYLKNRDWYVNIKNLYFFMNSLILSAYILQSQ